MSASTGGIGLRDELRVHGSATLYRLHDIGYAIALDHAADLLGGITRGRVRPSRLEARAIQIPAVGPILSNDSVSTRSGCSGEGAWSR